MRTAPAIPTVGVICAVALVGLSLAPSPARAYHEGIHLEVSPEIQSLAVGSVGTVTATLVSDNLFAVPASSDLEIDFENENGANDGDASISLNSPDFSCVIPLGSTNCTIDIEGTRTGKALLRAWIDSDRSSTTEADEREGRFAGFEDCRQQQDVGSSCSALENNVPVPNGAPIPGAKCSLSATPSLTAQAPGSEPDCTDVVEVNFIENAAGTLDCDDGTGPDTEHEVNPSEPTNTVAGDKPSTEKYTCSVRDQSGNLKPGVTVLGEIIDGVNDPDNGARFTSADLAPCTTREDDPTTTTVNEKGTCIIPVAQQSPPQKGIATICFWIGTLSEGALLCDSETATAGTNQDGEDQGDNAVDVVELAWESIGDFTLDCSPETGFSLINSVGTVECVVRSPMTDRPVQGVVVIAEAIGANDPDDSDTPQTQDAQPEFNASTQSPGELGCKTLANGRCSIKHKGEDAGETTYRVWIDDGVPEPDENRQGIDADLDVSEGRDEKSVPGTTGEPDGTDVVISDWGEGPASLALSPRTADASIGQCHEITITATDNDGNAAGGVRLDVEQQHENFRNSTASDEPIVGFCTPTFGPNPSDVDTARGDLQPSGGGPNTSGTAGGEAVAATNTDGQVTIGVLTQSAQSSDGSGTVYLTAWWETTDNDDPGPGEPSDSGLVSWSSTETTAVLELTPDVATNEPGAESTFTATATHNGAPLPGIEVWWSSSGVGDFTWSEATTDSAGQVTATIASSETGSTKVTATCRGQYTCADTSTQNWGPELCDVVGTDGDDVLTGSDASETICGFDGDDVIDGGGGDDVILGGNGNDRLTGGPGDDQLRGEAGRDSLDGGEGGDALLGGSGNDELKGGPGADALMGGDGDDDLSGGDGRDELVGGRGTDSLAGQKGRDDCYQGSRRSKRTAC